MTPDYKQIVPNKLRIKMVDFHAAHYLPSEYGKCHKLHGHTYTFEEIEIETEGVVDFATIKRVLEGADHMLLIPTKDREVWGQIVRAVSGVGIELPCAIEVYEIGESETTVEAIARHIEKVLLLIRGIKAVKFTLYETKNSGAVRPPR